MKKHWLSVFMLLNVLSLSTMLINLYMRTAQASACGQGCTSNNACSANFSTTACFSSDDDCNTGYAGGTQVLFSGAKVQSTTQDSTSSLSDPVKVLCFSKSPCVNVPVAGYTCYSGWTSYYCDGSSVPGATCYRAGTGPSVNSDYDSCQSRPCTEQG